MAIYADFGKIHGSVTAEGFKNHIEFNSFKLGSGRHILMEVGKGTNREGSIPSISEVSMDKKMDKSSPYFFVGSVAGKAIDKVEIKFVKTSKGGTEKYLTYTLYNVLVSGYDIGGSKDGDPQEHIGLAYTKIEMKYHPRNAENTTNSAIPTGYDVDTGKKL